MKGQGSALRPPSASENRGRLGRTVRLGPWVQSARRLARRSENIAFRTVRAYRLARDRAALVSRSGPGVTASTRLPLLAGVGALSFSGRGVHPVPSPVGRPLSNAGRDGGGPWSPAPSIRRPSPSRRRTDRLRRLSCGFARIPSTFTGRAVPSGGCRPPGPSRFGVGLRLTAPKPSVASPLRFSCLASPLSDRTLRSARRSPVAPVETPPVRVIRAWCSSGSARSGPAPGLVLAAWPAALLAFAGDVRGICSSPFAVLLRPSRRG
jgi:hypothetical protein